MESEKGAESKGTEIGDSEMVTRILLGKDKRKGFHWGILIYDSLRSAILRG